MAGQPVTRSDWERGYRLSADTALAVATVVAITTVLGALAQDRLASVERQRPAMVIVAAFAGVVLATSGAWASRGVHVGASLGLSIAIVALLLPVWGGWLWLPAVARASVLAAPPLAIGGVAHVALRWTADMRSTLASRGVWLLVIAAGAIHLVGYDPFADPACERTCLHVQPLAHGFLDLHQTVGIASALAVTATVVASAAVARRRATRPVRVTLAVLAALVMLGSIAVLRWLARADRSQSEVAVTVLASAALAVTGVAVLAVTARTRRVRRAMDDLVDRLASPSPAAWDGGDGVIRSVRFSVPDDGRWVDNAGRDIDAVSRSSHDVWVEIGHPSAPVLRLQLAPGNSPADVLAQLAPAARLSLRNAQLAAVTNARLADVRASRRRVVAASDGERRRIERDLHDGAQQRLVSAALYLSIARRRLRVQAPALQRAEAAVSDALAELRSLAHGIFPRVLGTEGLHAALDDIVALAGVPTTLAVDGDDAVPADVAMAVYATVAATLAAAEASHATWARVALGHRDGDVVVRIDSDGAHDPSDQPGWIEVVDRIGAVGGVVRTSTGESVATVSAVFPCAS